MSGGDCTQEERGRNFDLELNEKLSVCKNEAKLKALLLLKPLHISGYWECSVLATIGRYFSPRSHNHSSILMSHEGSKEDLKIHLSRSS